MPDVATLARPALAAALVLLAISPVWRLAVQDVRQHAALAAALLIGAQLLLGYWFYNYVIWFYPLLVVAVIQPPRDHPDARSLCSSSSCMSLDAASSSSRSLTRVGSSPVSSAIRRSR